MYLALVTLIVDDYDPAIAFFTTGLGFELVEDKPAAATAGGAPKRWVVVRPPSGEAGLLLARAEGDAQRGRIGDQTAGRVGFFLDVDDFEGTVERLRAHDVEFVREPRREPYGWVAVFRDIAGNRWDLRSQG